MSKKSEKVDTSAAVNALSDLMRIFKALEHSQTIITVLAQAEEGVKGLEAMKDKLKGEAASAQLLLDSANASLKATEVRAKEVVEKAVTDAKDIVAKAKEDAKKATEKAAAKVKELEDTLANMQAAITGAEGVLEQVRKETNAEQAKLNEIRAAIAKIAGTPQAG
jgi:23S rRNA pseudoU1915 N3-methylase RlmH